MAHSNPVQSVSRAMDILTLAAESADGIALRDMARAVGVTPSAAHNLARTLVLKGFLQRRGDPPRYAPGAMLLRVAQRYAHRGFLERAAACVEGLAVRYPKATVTLCESSAAEGSGAEVMTVLRMSPERPGVLERPAAMRMNAFSSASSLCFQAFWTDEEREDYYRRWPFDEFALPLWPSPKRLADYLAKVRQRGHAFLEGRTGRLMRVAVPVFDSQHALRATLGVAWVGTPAALAGVVKSIRAAAEELGGKSVGSSPEGSVRNAR